MRTVLEKFLEYNSNQCQILNIGAGFDTLAFHLAERNNSNITIYEVDFPDVLLKKANIIIKSKDLHDVLMGNISNLNISSVTTEYGYHFNQLHLVSSDLQHPQDLVSSLKSAGFQSTIPTLIFTECVLVCKLLNYDNCCDYL